MTGIFRFTDEKQTERKFVLSHKIYETRGALLWRLSSASSPLLAVSWSVKEICVRTKTTADFGLPEQKWEIEFSSAAVELICRGFYLLLTSPSCFARLSFMLRSFIIST